MRIKSKLVAMLGMASLTQAAFPAVDNLALRTADGEATIRFAETSDSFGIARVTLEPGAVRMIPVK